MKWSDDDIEYLRKNYANKSATEIAERLGRSFESVTVKASRLGIAREAKAWNTKEIKFMKAHYRKTKLPAMCDFLDRGYNSVKDKAFELGLTR